MCLGDEVTWRARHFGVTPSGSGRRQTFKDYIMPRMTNTFMLPGESTSEDIIRKVDLDGPSLCAFDPVDGGVIFNESEISIGDAPGLGIREIRGLEPLAT